jgi:hypothetical protein
MDKESTAFGLSPEQLASILKIGLDARIAEDKLNQEQKKAELLHDWLAATLPLDAVIVKALPTVLRRMFEQLRPLAGKPFGDLLKEPNTDIAAIVKIKDYSKKMVASAKSEAEHDAATAIYYAAIASALVFHNKTITKLSYKNLRDSFWTLSKQAWLTPDLAELFEKARKLCQDKTERWERESTK